MDQVSINHSSKFDQTFSAHSAAADDPFRCNELSPNGQLAMLYARNGIKVFPCRELDHPTDKKQRAKAPLVSWKKEACADPAKIKKWWDANPHALPGMPCGQGEVIVFDSDRHAGSQDGVALFNELVAAHGGLPDGTPIIRTPNNGTHTILRVPLGCTHGNSKGRLPEANEVRGDGGYIIAPGTVWIQNGVKRGEWATVEGTPEFIDAYANADIPFIPNWLWDILTKSNNSFEIPLSERARAKKSADHNRKREGRSTNGDERRYVEWVLEFISSENREDWLKVGMALHASGQPWGREVWDAWSATTPGKFGHEGQQQAWESFDRPYSGARVTLGTIVEMARRNGFNGFKGAPELSEGMRAQIDRLCDKNDRDSIDDDSQDQLTDDDLLSTVVFDGDELPAPVPTIVQDTIPKEGPTFLGGQSGAGKTYCAVDLAGALATNQQFFGRDTNEKCGVIYFAAEGYATLPARMAAMKISRGVKDEKLPIAFVKYSDDLANNKDRIAAIKLVRAISRKIERDFGLRVGAIIIDTLSAAFSFKDENNSAEMNDVCKKATQIGAAIGAATIILHHYGKDPSTGLRGSSALRGAGESVISVLGKRDELLGTCENRRLVHTKSRVGEEGLISGFDLKSIPVGTDNNGDTFYAAHVVLNDTAVMITTTKSEKAPKQAYHTKVFMDSLQKALLDFGEMRRPYADGPEVKVVDRRKVRNFFDELWAVDVDDRDDEATQKKKKEDTRRQAFNRGAKDAATKHLTAYRDVGGVQLIWLARQGNMANIDWEAFKNKT